MTNDFELRRLREKVEMLTGERGGRDGAALRAGDVRRQLARITVPDLTARDAAGVVTVDQYNAVVNDLRAMRAALLAIRQALG